MDALQLRADIDENLAIRRFRELRARRAEVTLATVHCGSCGAEQHVRVQPGMRRVALVCTECLKPGMALVP